MKPHIKLTISSLLSAALFTVHLSHDLLFGLDAMSRANTVTYLLIMLVWLYGAIELSGRRSGYVIMLLGAVLATGMPVLHNVGGPRAIKLGFFFVWTLLALGANGVFALVLSARELVTSFRRSPADAAPTV